MSDSTTQQNKAAAEGTFSRELNKKIRNKNKKIQQIKDADAKIKAEGKSPTPQHLTKLASIPQLEADIAEFKTYLELYNQSEAELEKKQNVLRKQHAKELTQARKSAVTQVANMITMHTLLDCGQKIPEEIEEGVNHFRENINRLTLRTEASSNWRTQRDAYISEWTKLCSGSQDTIPHTEVSYEELASGVVEAISSGGYPEEVSKPKREKKSKKHQAAEQQQPEAEVKEAQVEQVQEEEAKPEPVVAEPEPTVAEEAEPQPVEEEVVAKEESPVQEEENTQAQEEVPQQPKSAEKTESPDSQVEEQKQGKSANKEAEVRTRDERRSRGERGRGRGGRGDRRGRGRGNYYKRDTGEDAEGFITVKEDNEPSRGRGYRGRGYRGRGERGGFRGERGAFRGERGSNRSRGERPQRKGKEFAEGKQINEKPDDAATTETKAE